MKQKAGFAAILAVVGIRIVFGMILGGKLNAPPVPRAATAQGFFPAATAEPATAAGHIDFSQIAEAAIPAVVGVSNTAGNRSKAGGDEDPEQDAPEGNPGDEFFRWFFGPDDPHRQMPRRQPQQRRQSSVFQAAADHVGERVAILVFDLICDDYPDPDCAGDIHPEDTLVTSAGGSYYYHIIGFAAFYISCVNAPGMPGPECPGHQVASDVLGIIPNNTKTIEGYFVVGFGPGSDNGICSGLDLGYYSRRLTK